jgi:hypothetical protein
MSGVVKKSSGSELTEVVSMRLSLDDKRLLDAVAAQVPVVPALTLARIAMRIGLAAIRQDPARALAPQGRRHSR